MLLKWIIGNLLKGKRLAKIKISIGKNVRGVPYIISGNNNDDSIIIGNYVSISNDVVLIPSNGHIPRKDLEHLRISLFPLTSLKGNKWNSKYLLKDKAYSIFIGSDVWLCSGAKVLSGVRIGNGCIIGANSTVCEDMPDFSICAGSPAKIIRFRYTPRQREALLRIKWWNWNGQKIHNNLDLFYDDIDKFIKKFDI